jgi:hypothetical protein
MPFQKIFLPLAALALLVFAFYRYSWAGLAVTSGALVMWLLLHFSRMMQILKRAANRPIGYVDSAVMLNAKLRPGVNLLHVVAMTRALGELQSPPDTQPEVFRWTDGSDSQVSCVFLHGKLQSWELKRPNPPDDLADEPTDETVNPAASAP